MLYLISYFYHPRLEYQWRVTKKEFSVTMPLKIHMIIHHLSDYFKETGETLFKSTDHVVESCHHKVKHFFDTHPCYNHMDNDTDEYGEACKNVIIHYNYNNTG